MSGARLDYVGYAKLRPGRIHLYCDKCGRKQSNMPRTEFDPRRAVLVRIWCDKCDAGCKDSGAVYMDARGKEIPFDA